MTEIIIASLIGFAAAAALFFWMFISRANRSPRPINAEIHASIENLRAVGELVVFRIVTKEIVTAADHWFGEAGKKYMRWLVSDRKMREFNRSYRGVDSSTDVLAFVDDEATLQAPPYLGDIVISVSTAARQASRASHSLSRELRVLALHGYLHLVGYDHEVDDGAMMRVQRKLVRKMLPRRARSSSRRRVVSGQRRARQLHSCRR